MTTLKVLELFGGIGASRKALERIGVPFEIVDYVEIDKYVVKSYNAIYGTNYETQDIKEWDKDIEYDLLFHGSPCQNFSVIGDKKGGDENSGTKSSLMYETIRIISKIKPKCIIWENVKGLLNKKNIHNFNKYINTLKEFGYENKWEVLNSKYYNNGQMRERIYVVSILKKNKFNFPKKQKSKKTIYNYLDYNMSDETLKFVTPKEQQLINLKNKKSIFKNRFVLKKMTDCAYTITTKGRYHSWTNNFIPINYIELVKENNNADYIIDNNIKFRGFSPLETWRLMGFDDEDFYKAKQVCSNSQLYKQAGNSIVVNVLEEIFKELYTKKKGR